LNHRWFRGLAPQFARAAQVLRASGPLQTSPRSFFSRYGSRHACFQKSIKSQARKAVMQLKKKAQESLERVIERFKSGDLSPIVKVARTKLSVSAPSNSWSLCNRVLAFAQTDELDCRGYGQWQSVGRFIKKGERAAYIFRPHVA